LQVLPPRYRAGPRRAGFTLVELLVVIGIIALLISILLPTLNAARSSAKSIVCASNLRQLSLGFIVYANDFEGSLPPGSTAQFTGGAITGDWAPFWYDRVFEYIDLAEDAGTGTFNRGDYGDAFICPDAYLNAGYMHYGVHPRLSPRQGPPGFGMGDPNRAGQPFQPYKLAQVPNSSEILLVADARQFNAPDVDGGRVHGNAPWYMGLFGHGGMFNHKFTSDPENPISGTGIGAVDGDTPVPLVTIGNRDLSADAGEWNFGDVRFRHRDDEQLNIGYLDGHVGSKTIGRRSDTWDTNPQDVDAGTLKFKNIMLIEVERY
jgi:prepilin-type N-terminal cleavage/methylation domain-containing protein/prepilin-type processing-associated H-X9-DG protein